MNTIILVEDDPDDVYFFRQACSSVCPEIGLEVFSDGESLCQFAESQGLHDCLVLLDLNMTGMSGIDTLKKLQADPHFVSYVLVVYTTSTNPKDVKLAYENGAKSYIAKPSSPVKLGSMVKTLVDYWFGINTRSNPGR